MNTLQNLLVRFAEMRNEATSNTQAVNEGKLTFLKLDKNFAYGGYRLTRVKVNTYGECGCYGVGDTSQRMNTKVMEAYLKGLINSNNP